MSLCNFEYISSHLEIIIQIYQHLAFVDQLRLSRVSDYLKCVFETFVWKEKYVTLYLLERTNEFVVSNAHDISHMCLSSEAAKEFIEVYAGDVQNLVVRTTVLDTVDYEGLDDLTQGQMIVNQQLDIKLFRNLKSLSYFEMKVPRDHVKLVAQLYPNLQELKLINCGMGPDISAIIERVVPQLQKLKILCTSDVLSYQLSYKDFYEIITKRPLECLRLKAILEPDKNVMDMDNSPPAHCSTLRHLSIRTFFDPAKWSNNYAHFLRNFENLVILDLEIGDAVSDTMLATIAKTCKNLDTLSLRFTTFENVEYFSMPAKLSSLSLYWCKGLTYNNLRHILTQPVIKKFQSTHTCFLGVLKAYSISPLIETINIDDILTERLNATYEYNEHLKELTWYHQWFNDDIITAPSLVTCKNLEILDMQECHLSIHTLLQLQSLRKFSMPHPMPIVPWSYITDLLQHPPLRELYIRVFSRTEYVPMLDNVPHEGVATNVTKLEIPLDLFEIAVEFWMDIFSNNKSLTQIRCIFEPAEEYGKLLKIIIYHQKFPRAVKTINLSGLIISK